MVTVHMIPNLEEVIEVIMRAIETDDTSSLDRIQAESLVKKIDILRTQYNTQLKLLRNEYGPKLTEAIEALNKIISKS